MVLRLKEKGVTSVFVTHDMPTAFFAICDRFCLLMDGVVKATGTVAIGRSSGWSFATLRERLDGFSMETSMARNQKLESLRSSGQLLFSSQS